MTRRPIRYGSLLVLMAASISLAVAAADRDLPDDSGKARARPGREAGRSASESRATLTIKGNAEAFVEAYNRRDSEALSLQFSDEGEFITEENVVIRGRAAIAAHFAAAFEARPEARLSLNVESIRPLAPDVAVEEGTVLLVPAPGETPLKSRYTAMHVRRGDKWLVVRSRDFQVESQPGPTERLSALDWLVGDWIDESGQSLVETSCRWVDGRSFLLQDFTLHTPASEIVTGSTRIGWDPQARQIRSWTFDSRGGFSEGIWSRFDEATWMIKTRGVTRSGRTFSVTNILRHIDDSTMMLASRDRIEGDKPVEPREPVTIKRRPPEPSE